MLERIGSTKLIDRTRAEFDESVTSGELAILAARDDLGVLQTVQPAPDATWSMLNSEFFAKRPDVELRVYGHYSSECDLSFAGRMSNVRRFSADSLMRAENLHRVADMHLESLGLGVFELESFDLLQGVTSTIERLFLGSTRSKKPDLALLARFESLRELKIEGHSKGIEVLAHLRTLEDLTLRSVTTDDLTYLTPLPRLRSLDIKLGGILSLAGIEGKGLIKYLELWQVRGLSDIGVIAHLPGMQSLFLQSLPRVEELPSFRALSSLRRVVLQNMKGLKDFSELEHAPALEEFALIQGNAQEPEMLVPVVRNPSLCRATAGFGSDRKNLQFHALLAQYEVEEFEWEPFAFR